LQGVRKQLEITQADVDEARQAVFSSGSSDPIPEQTLLASSPRAAAAAVPTMQGHARLANDGPPLLPDPPAMQPVHPLQPPPVRRNVEPVGWRVQEDEGDYIKPPKHDFPRFDGNLSNLWLDRCVAYFDLYRVKPQNWVTIASLYVDGHVALWLQAFRQLHAQVGCTRFCQAVVEEFGPDKFEAQMHKLLQLRQTGTVATYRQQFEVYMYHLLTLDPSLSTKFFVTQFLLGPNDELRAAVRIQAPSSITRATVFAKIQEEELEVTRPRPRLVPAGRPPPLPEPIPPRPAAPVRAAGDDFGWEQQLRDFRLANGLCFKCGDRYTREHQCKPQGAQLLTIQVGDFREVLSDDAVQALELLDEPPVAAVCCMLSAQAIAGTESPACIHLPVRVFDQAMLLLLDSGSSHSFVSTQFVQRLNLPTIPIAPVSAKVVNGKYVQQHGPAIGMVQPGANLAH
jgi:hypothetical protein